LEKSYSAVSACEAVPRFFMRTWQKTAFITEPRKVCDCSIQSSGLAVGERRV
jgi:hypothetical protein